MLIEDWDSLRAARRRCERREHENVYHRIERDGLKKTAPSFDWDVYFREVGAPKLTTLNVSHVLFFEAVEKLTTTISAIGRPTRMQCENSAFPMP